MFNETYVKFLQLNLNMIADCALIVDAKKELNCEFKKDLTPLYSNARTSEQRSKDAKDRPCLMHTF